MQDYLLVDGYNIIFAWDELKELARENIDAARAALADILCNYQGFRQCRVILVFDAYKVRGGRGEVCLLYTSQAPFVVVKALRLLCAPIPVSEAMFSYVSASLCPFFRIYFHFSARAAR